MTMDLTPAEVGYIGFLLRDDHRRLLKTRASLAIRFGASADLSTKDAKLALNAALKEKLKSYADAR